MSTEDIFVNINSNTIADARVVSLTNIQSRPFRKLPVGDQRAFNLYFTDGAGAYVDVSSYSSIRVGVGGINKVPTSGTFELTNSTTDSCAFDISASGLSNVLTNIGYTQTSVFAPRGGTYIVKFTTVGVQTLPTSNASDLTPDSSISIKELVTGSATVKAEWLIRLFETPWAYSETWTNITNGVTGGLGFGSENLFRAMGTNNSLQGFLEIELTDASANIRTVIQAPVQIVGEVIGNGVAGSAEWASYLTKTYESIIISCSDETSDLATNANLVIFRPPFAMTLTEVRASCFTAPSGAEIIVDIKENAVSLLSTLITIDAGDQTSGDATVPPVISDTVIADDSQIVISLNQVGSGVAGTGLKVYMNGYRT
jgi:hypothetical protein|tara:strand:- start:87 stop:1196 length:1110 start_codon:yes stop_codon:yes gene_type:complete